MSGTVTIATGIGDAPGSAAAAAALACAGSVRDRAGLLVDLGPARAPRPALVSTAAARELEERLAVHVPNAAVASRGQVCHLALPPDEEGLEQAVRALALARDSIGVVHLMPDQLQPALHSTAIRASGALLRADPERDRALLALTVRDLLDRGLRVGVLKRPLSWVPARRALFGVLPAGAQGGLPARLTGRLLGEAGGVADLAVPDAGA